MYGNFSYSFPTLMELYITVLVFIKNTEDPIYANFSSSFPDCLLHLGILLKYSATSDSLVKSLFSLPRAGCHTQLEIPLPLLCSPEGTSKQKPVQSCRSPCLFPASLGPQSWAACCSNQEKWLFHIFSSF